ncbi:MAG: hypothetical protein H7Z41_16460 [Cytophagales bacterium]|nr:hypothetical protein [Armatimonadota bacterium]
MKTGRRTVLAGMLGAVVAGVLPALPAMSQTGSGRRFDFGLTDPGPDLNTGYTRVLTTHTTANMIANGRTWGWVSNTGLAARDRGGPAPLQRDFIFLNSTAARTFRIGALTPGRYRITVLSGDLTNGDHYTRVQVPGIDGAAALPVLHPGTAQYVTLTATLVVPQGSTTLDITFDATQINWVVNALILEPVTDAETPRVTIAWNPLPASLWSLPTDDPTAAMLAGHRTRVASNMGMSFQPTGLTRSHYLSLITGQVDFWKTKQNPANGAIIDPYLNREFQYSTPAYAHAAATLVAYAGRADLLETAALALDWSARTLSTRRAASGHEDFFAPMIAHAIRLLKPFVPAERSARWEYDIWFFEPLITYRFGAGVNNWNIVAACGEAMFQTMKIRDAGHPFVAASFARQGDNFDSTLGLYLEEAMPYDQFPRLWVSDLIGRGYSGPYTQELNETLRRGSITSLFMQSPTGEHPAGGRSAHHQWNEAQQCVIYEVYAARALTNSDGELAAYFKRAAHLSLQSMQRWVRPSGEMQIVKNWIDPSQNFGYETYSSHSQYNLLAMSMLAIAYEHAETTEGMAELPAPSDIGGYVVQTPRLNKVFANAGGSYVEIETAGDHDYDATGLIRVHFAGHSPQIGSDSVLKVPSYVIPIGSAAPLTTGIGVSWLGADSVWRHQGELTPAQITGTTVTPTETVAGKVRFSVTYSGTFGGGVSSIVEQYELTANAVQVTTTLPDFTGAVRRVVPLLSDDGRVKCKIQATGEVIKLAQPGTDWGGKFTYRMLGASTVTVPTTQYANHNGWARLATGEYAAGAGQTGVTLRIEAQPNPNAPAVPV